MTEEKTRRIRENKPGRAAIILILVFLQDG